MTAKRKRIIVGLAAVALVMVGSAGVMAQCGSCGGSVAYQPVAYQAYSPVVYETYRPYTSWYPGYWIGRMNNAVWGRPLWPSYHAWYRRGYEVAYAPTAAYYAPTTTCAPSYSCAMPVSTVSEVVMRPVCATACDPCTTSCSTAVTQATYEVPATSSCAPCAVTQPTTTVVQPAPTVVQPAPGAAQPPAAEPQPTLSPSETPPAERTFRKEPANNETEPTPTTPQEDNNSTYFEAPQLFNPQDRTAERSAAPVQNAVYHKVSSPASADAASWHQYDAAGWVSASL